MVPGGCFIKHPGASLDADANSGNIWSKNQPTEDNPAPRIFAFWMHNARGIKNPKLNYCGEVEDNYWRKEHLVCEAVEYFKKLWKDREFQTFHPSLVFHPFV